MGKIVTMPYPEKTTVYNVILSCSSLLYSVQFFIIELNTIQFVMLNFLIWTLFFYQLSNTSYASIGLKPFCFCEKRLKSLHMSSIVVCLTYVFFGLYYGMYKSFWVDFIIATSCEIASISSPTFVFELASVFNSNTIHLENGWSKKQKYVMNHSVSLMICCFTLLFYHHLFKILHACWK